MPAMDSPAMIVARYLKTNHPESYEAFISEANLPYEAGNISKGDLTLETLLEEKKTFDISAKFEKMGIEDLATSWTNPAPSQAVLIESLPSASNILSIYVADLEDGDEFPQPMLLASTADRRLHILDASTRLLRQSFSTIHDSPVLSLASFRRKFILSTSMSGQFHVSDTRGRVLDQRRDHSKYLVKVAVLDDGINDALIATAGWDSKVTIYQPSITSSTLTLGDPKAILSLPTKPEALTFLRHPSNGEPLLLLSRTDSTCLYFYTTSAPPRLLGKQNLAPHSNAWVAFTPSALELSPHDPTLLAVGTSTVPHMKLLIVRLLFPPWGEEETPEVSRPPPTTVTRPSLLDNDDGPTRETQASQARAALAIADREDAAILIHCTTLASQTAYSTPAVAWRPNGSGVWVNGDDGAIRGIAAGTGKIMVTLKEGHEAGSKVRCLWAGHVGEKEVLVSGGFDRRLVVWEV